MNHEHNEDAHKSHHTHHAPHLPKKGDKEYEKLFYTRRGKKDEAREVIYGVTDRRNVSFLKQIDDLLIDHSGVSLKDKGMFFHSLKLMVASGVRFTRALRMLGARTRNVRFARVLNTVAYDLDYRGSTLSQAMEKFPDVFSPSETKMIYSGEITGKIEQSLETVATQIQKNLEIDIKVRSALMYPLVVFVGIVIASIVVILYIVPKISGLFDSFGAELPLYTRILIGLSDFLRHGWWIALSGCIFVVLMFLNWVSTPEGKRAWHRFILNFPYIKTLVNNIQVVRLSSNFASLMDSGVPVSKSLQILSSVVPNAVVSDAILNIESKVRSGTPIHEAFSAEEDLDPIVGEVMEVGEKSGSISTVMNKLAWQYDLEVESQLKNISTLIEPLAILIVGMGVLFLALAIILPLFQVQQLFLTVA